MPCSGKEKKFLLAVVALDMLAVGLIVPLLTPFMRETLGASPSTMGMMGSLYGIVVEKCSVPFQKFFWEVLAVQRRRVCEVLLYRDHF